MAIDIHEIVSVEKVSGRLDAIRITTTTEEVATYVWPLALGFTDDRLSTFLMQFRRGTVGFKWCTAYGRR